MEALGRSALATFTFAALVSLTPALASADAVLSGTVTGQAGDKMGGVSVSAKAEGQSITTSVFTDAAGRYYFPPLPAGHYRVWAQADAYQTAKGKIDLSAARQQNFALAPLDDFERQLTGDQVLTALPEATPEDKRMKRLVHNNCSGCHEPNYILQHRFDEAGWSKIIDLMKNVNVAGIYQGSKHKPNEIVDFHEKELAAYLARARGPGPSSMSFKLRPRPTGEAARVVIREYDVPVPPELGVDKTQTNDGSDWSLGTPSHAGALIHDAWADLDGNLWYTSNMPNHSTTIGRIDARTGAVTPIKIPGEDGRAAQAHGMTRDRNGIIWFNVYNGRGGLARLDPKTRKIDVYMPPAGMSPTGGAVTVDWDGQGKIWASAPDGVLRFDPATKQFREFKSPTFKTAQGTGLTYGVAADRDGNGYWAQMAFDIVDRADLKTGRAIPIRVPPIATEMDGITPREQAMYDRFSQLDFNTPYPWSQGPRRMGADKNGDVLWVCDFWGGNLVRVDTHTLKTKIIPVPNAAVEYPYHATVDRNHNVWVNMMNSNQVLRYDPKSGKFTYFDLPTLGVEARYVSLLEERGRLEVVVPYFRTNKVAVMTFRSEAEMAALRKGTPQKQAAR